MRQHSFQFVFVVLIMTILLWVGTQIVSGDTHPVTQQPNGLDTLELTASEIVRQVTAQASALMPTLAPTMTLPNLTAQADLRSHYRDQLVQAAGFDHPIFDQIVDEIIKNATREKAWVDDIEIQNAKIDFAGVRRVFLVVAQHPTWLIDDYLYVFRLTDQTPILEDPIPDVNGYMVSLGYGRLVNWNAQMHQFDDEAIPTWLDFANPFSDWNANGLPDLVIVQGDLGNCCLPRLRLLELTLDGGITDISAPDADVVPYAFVKKHHHGSWEMVGINRRAGASPEYYHWFGWNGTRYVDNSDQHIDFYQPDIDAFKQKLLSQSICYNPYDLTLQMILSDYAAIHQLEQGWAEIEPLLHWDTCTDDELRIYGNQIKAIEANVKAHRY